MLYGMWTSPKAQHIIGCLTAWVCDMLDTNNITTFTPDCTSLLLYISQRVCV